MSVRQVKGIQVAHVLTLASIVLRVWADLQLHFSLKLHVLDATRHC